MSIAPESGSGLWKTVRIIKVIGFTEIIRGPATIYVSR